MKVSVSAIMFCVIFKIKLCSSKYGSALLTVPEDNLQIPCDTDRECRENGLTKFKCLNMICTCIDKMCEEPELITVVTKVGQNCTKSVQCGATESFCNMEGKCQCKENAVSSENKRKCLSVMQEIGSPCEEDIQCTLLNGVCTNKRCNCPSGKHLAKGICFSTVGLDLLCKSNEECSHTKFSICKDNLCTCDADYVKDSTDSKCLRKAPRFLSPCSEDIQCTSTLGSGSSCFQGSCKCMELYRYKTDINKCVVNALLGETCGNHGDCHQPGNDESRLECVAGECKCKPSYFEDEGYCLPNSASNWPLFNLPVTALCILWHVMFY